MFVRVKKKAPREYYEQLIRDFERCKINLNAKQLKYVFDMLHKKDERSK